VVASPPDPSATTAPAATAATKKTTEEKENPASLLSEQQKAAYDAWRDGEEEDLNSMVDSLATAQVGEVSVFDWFLGLIPMC
jgi:hypothetical protein